MQTGESFPEKEEYGTSPSDRHVRRLVWGLGFGFALIYLAFLVPLANVAIFYLLH
jgi:hypothetical protein